MTATNAAQAPDDYRGWRRDWVWFRCPSCGDVARYKGTLTHADVTIRCTCGGVKVPCGTPEGKEYLDG